MAVEYISNPPAVPHADTCKRSGCHCGVHLITVSVFFLLIFFYFLGIVDDLYPL